MAATDGAGFPASELPSPPFIVVPGLPNFRDAGGYEVMSDLPSASSTEGKSRTKMVRRGVLFRSSEVGSCVPLFEVSQEPSCLTGHGLLLLLLTSPGSLSARVFLSFSVSWITVNSPY